MRTSHILHLMPDRLRWAKVEELGRRARLAAHGSIEGEAGECLDQWWKEHGRPREEVLLYDGRPMYFSFAIELPAKAKKQADQAVKLKILSELGLAEDEVYWNWRADASQRSGEPLRLTITVTRRDVLSDVEAWKDRHSIESLWVGADVDAIGALARRRLLETPVVIVNREGSASTVYHAREDSQVLKGRSSHSEEEGEPQFPNLGWEAATPCSVMGAGSEEAAGDEGTGARIDLPEASPLDWSRDGLGGKIDGAIVTELQGFDAVILGAMVDRTGAGQRPKSLLESAALSADSGPPVRWLQLRWIAPLALLLGVLLGVSVWSLRGARETARIDLVKRANSLASSTRRYRSQEAILKRIKADRALLIPIVEAIHESIPSQVTLQSMNISESGQVQLAGSTKNADAPNLFLKSLSQSELFEGVFLSEVKQDRQQGMFSFQLTTRIKGRGRARGRRSLR